MRLTGTHAFGDRQIDDAYQDTSAAADEGPGTEEAEVFAKAAYPEDPAEDEEEVGASEPNLG